MAVYREMKPQDLLTFHALSLGESERRPLGYYTHYLANNGQMQVALHPHGGIIGYSMAKIPKEPKGYGQIELKDVYVHPAHRRVGTFRRFMNDLWGFAVSGGMKDWHAITCVNRVSRMCQLTPILGRVNFIYDRHLPYFYPAVKDPTRLNAHGIPVKRAMFKEREDEEGFMARLPLVKSREEEIENELAYKKYRHLGDCIYHDVGKKKPLWERDHLTTYD